jgi:hypothetical protein
MSGWIKIHRSITDHWLYKEKRVYSKLEAWYDLLINVNYIDSKTMIKGKLYEVKRGQSIMSLESWGKRWNWEKSKVRRFLNLLQNDTMIVLTSDNITTQITICNYDSYQAERNANETQTKRKRKSNENQTTPIEESKEIKNNIIPSFDEFLQYAIKNKPFVNQTDLRLKYESWKANEWCTNKAGKQQPIVNWKSTLLNTLPFIAEIKLNISNTLEGC